MVGVRGYGSYVPLYRIERSSIAEQHGGPPSDGEVAVPGHDEGVLTMAVSAAKNALEVTRATAESEPSLDAVYAATTSDPFDERGLAPHVAHAVDAPTEVRVGDFQGSARAATNALLAAADAIRARTADRVLVVAADVVGAAAGSTAERTAGAGAGAVVLTADGTAATLTNSGANTTGFVGRFKRTAESPETGDARFNRARAVEALRDVLCTVESDATHAVVGVPDAGWGRRALAEAEVDATHQTAFDAVGYAGAGGVLLDLGLALERAGPGEGVVLAAYGPGGSDALAFETGDGIDRRPDPSTETYLQSKEYVTYAKHRAYRDRAGGVA